MGFQDVRVVSWRGAKLMSHDSEPVAVVWRVHVNSLDPTEDLGYSLRDRGGSMLKDKRDRRGGVGGERRGRVVDVISYGCIQSMGPPLGQLSSTH